MPLTNFPNGINATPNLGGDSGAYDGRRGKNVWYVDDDDGGSDDDTGKNTTKGFKTIQKAINVAGAGDTIYLKPREITIGTNSSHGYYTGTNIIAADQQGLAIIGTGRGGRGIGMGVQCMIEPDSGSTDVSILVQSPGVSIENLGVKCVTGASGGIAATSATNEAYGLTVSNCFFKDFKATATAIGTINLRTIHWATIQHCIFREAGVAIHHQSDQAAVQGIVIRDCDFIGAAATWMSDIRIGDCKNLVIDNCRFQHALPSGGAPNVYVSMVGTSGTGMVSNCNFSSTEQGVTNLTDFVVTVL